jgi:signal transduction histidine kinase
MRQRLRDLGGRLEIVSNNGGTTITAIVPLDGESAYGPLLTYADAPKLN